MIDLRDRNGTPITGLEEWPHRDEHWKPGRSAMELARAWFRAGEVSVPAEFQALLESHERFHDIELGPGRPEHVTKLPQSGRGRTHDLALLARTAHELVTICVEAKADEPFGNYYVGNYWSREEANSRAGKSTGVPERIQALVGIVDPESSVPPESRWSAIRYQLLTALCGTVLQAEVCQSSAAILVIHEYHTELTQTDNIARNRRDLDVMVSTLSGRTMTVEPGRLYGPYCVKAVDCFVGKAVATTQ
jgi:hypothetical protein